MQRLQTSQHQKRIKGTGHGADGKLPALDWNAIAHGSPTLVLYMARKYAGDIAQKLIAAGRNPKIAALIALVFSAVLFGLAHLGGGLSYALAATVAGLGYGAAYLRTQRIEAAMAVHFSVNALHFLLFTYPRLA